MIDMHNGTLLCRPCRPENSGISVIQAFDLGYYVAPFQGLPGRLFFILNCKYPILPASIHYINAIIPSPYSPTLFHNPPIFSHLIYIDFFLPLMIEKTHDGYDDSWWIWWTMLFWFHLSLTYAPISRGYTRFIHRFIFVFSPYE